VTLRFPGLADAVVSPRWAAVHEHCRTLDDYLRRRTNIAQWIRRGGLGADDEHAAAIAAIARTLHGSDDRRAAEDVQHYRSIVDRDVALLGSLSPGTVATRGALA
jgi:glycerol-3-phosphate dehydrogenase